jgi:hypothetical protein
MAFFFAVHNKEVSFMKSKFTFFTFLISLSYAVTAQVGVGVTGSVNASAKLQVDATNKGFLPPRVVLSATNVAAPVTSPATGLMVYNTATAGSGTTAVTPGIYYWDGLKWQRVINQQPDATVTFDGTNPNSATVFSGTQQSTDYIYVSNTDASQWIWKPDATPSPAYVTYVPPASTPWYSSGGTTDAGSNKTGAVYRSGKVGIGDFSATTPATSLEVKSGVADNSGLRLTNLTSTSPTSGGATLGVDASGNVVTVNGSSFSPVFGTARPSTTVNVASNTSALLTSVTITTTGTYLLNYTMRVQPNADVPNQFAIGFLSLDNTSAIVGTEILGAFPGPGTSAAPGGNYSGSHVITINSVPTTIYFRASAANGQMNFIDDTSGRTKISYVKVTP